jgi:hypothetical protein
MQWNWVAFIFASFLLFMLLFTELLKDERSGRFALLHSVRRHVRRNATSARATNATTRP